MKERRALLFISQDMGNLSVSLVNPENKEFRLLAVQNQALFHSKESLHQWLSAISDSLRVLYAQQGQKISIEMIFADGDDNVIFRTQGL